ncbi:hypothetical protein IWX90DRAFT_413002 [Phyllosticta citrichinensis]|uniref:Uncharacterized protein n=1 Tax=Phyllosticta citrichinensis TaxID=1130410 RepID=A0ABR1XZ53_9PEZI
MTNENQKMPSLTSGLDDGAPRYTYNFAPASYGAAVPYIDTRRDTEQLWPVDPRVITRPPPNADSYSGALNSNSHMSAPGAAVPYSDTHRNTERIRSAVPLVAPRPASSANSHTGLLNSKNNMPNTTTPVSDNRTQRNTERIWPLVPLVAPLPAPNADSCSGALNSKNDMPNTTTTVPDKRTHTIVPAIPRPTSNADGSASMSVTDGRGSGESRESQRKKGPENIDRLAQHCAFARQQIEALFSRLDDKLGDVHPQHHEGCTCSCATTAREKQQQEEKGEGQWQSEVKQLLRQLQQQLHQQFQHTQEMSGRLARMDERPWLVKTQELQQAIDSLQEEIKQLKVERQIEWVRAEKVAEERRLKQSQEADRVKQLEDAMRRLTHLEHQVNVETGAVNPDEVERDWLLVTQRGMF